MTKTIYQDWIVEIGRDPNHREDNAAQRDSPEPDEGLLAEVNRAIKTLPDSEQDFIHLYYFSGQTLMEIARKFNISYSRAGNIHGRIIRKLKKELA
ncbi:MAG: sigma-70 family RNA polymerase sigma factor, partial [Candidatus Zixiibacteriota bacterium]